MLERLPRSFYSRPTLEVAKDLLGKKLLINHIPTIITETEAYIGRDDPACHAARGLTPRTAIMFGPPGFTYVYFIYGMYHCLNIVTEPEGHPSAVLIRGCKTETLNLNGPGKLCRYFGLTRTDTGKDIISDPNITILNAPSPNKILATPRIGIKVATDKLWRFVIS